MHYLKIFTRNTFWFCSTNFNLFFSPEKCVTEDGGVYYDGDSWFPDPDETCYVCICDRGTIDCFDDEECKTGLTFRLQLQKAYIKILHIITAKLPIMSNLTVS